MAKKTTPPQPDVENLLELLVEERAKFTQLKQEKNVVDWLDDNECALLVNAVAWRKRQDGWGLSGKKSGIRGKLPDGTEIAHDILHHQPTNVIVDVLYAAGEVATPRWNVLGVQEDLKRRPWVAPVDPQTFPPSQEELEERMLEILEQLEARVIELQSQVNAIAGRLEQIEHDNTQNALAAQRTEAALTRDGVGVWLVPTKLKWLGEWVGRVGGTRP